MQNNQELLFLVIISTKQDTVYTLVSKIKKCKYLEQGGANNNLAICEDRMQL